MDKIELEKLANEIAIKKLETLKEVLLNSNEFDKAQSWFIANKSQSAYMDWSIKIREEMTHKINKEINMALPNSISGEIANNRKNNTVRVFNYVDNKTRWKVRFTFDEIDDLID